MSIVNVTSIQKGIERIKKNPKTSKPRQLCWLRDTMWNKKDLLAAAWVPAPNVQFRMEQTVSVTEIASLEVFQNTLQD